MLFSEMTKKKNICATCSSSAVCHFLISVHPEKDLSGRSIKKNGRYCIAKLSEQQENCQHHFPTLDRLKYAFLHRAPNWCGQFALLGRQLVMLKRPFISVKYELWDGLIWPCRALYAVVSTLMNVSLALEPVCNTEGEELLDGAEPKPRLIPSSKLLDTKKVFDFSFKTGIMFLLDSSSEWFGQLETYLHDDVKLWFHKSTSLISLNSQTLILQIEALGCLTYWVLGCYSTGLTREFNTFLCDQ